MSDLPTADPAELGELYRLTSEFIDRSTSGLRRLKVNAGSTSLEIEWPDPAAGGVPGNGAAAAENPAGPALSEASAGAVDEGADHYVRAPLVGTFYRAPAPGEKPFVEVGDIVVAGQQVAILEAMKLMNPVEADKDGRVTAIMLPDATSVEYDQPLIAISDD